jgi:hypothetical protein
MTHLPVAASGLLASSLAESSVSLFIIGSKPALSVMGDLRALEMNIIWSDEIHAWHPNE